MPLTKEYLAENTVHIAKTREEGYEFCKTMHAIERIAHGKAITRYRVSGRGRDCVCSEDIEQETAKALMNDLVSPVDAPLPPGMKLS
ncbi:MAG: hypothetical protein HZB65_00880 [Candidatus Aenigmarchaeota archaeon]|nr:hypothetical protein [Candidatus Aenigmarchaeota archaeon]